MTYHVLTDAHGAIVAWVRAEPVFADGPRVVLAPLDPAHILHEHVRVDAELNDRGAVAEALRQAIRPRS